MIACCVVVVLFQGEVEEWSWVELGDALEADYQPRGKWQSLLGCACNGTLWLSLLALLSLSYLSITASLSMGSSPSLCLSAPGNFSELPPTAVLGRLSACSLPPFIPNKWVPIRAGPRRQMTATSG